MTKVTAVGLDLAKTVFQVHGADRDGRPVVREKLRRGQVIPFFADLAPCLIGMKACAGAHYWARELQGLGHEVRLIPPQYVKPFVKTNKNDASDAEAICEALMRPTMRIDMRAFPLYLARGTLPNTPSHRIWITTKQKIPRPVFRPHLLFNEILAAPNCNAQNFGCREISNLARNTIRVVSSGSLN